MKPVRAKLCSITVLATALCMVGWAGNAAGATPCPTEALDETSRTLSVSYPSDWTGKEVHPFTDYGLEYDPVAEVDKVVSTWQSTGGCSKYDRPASVVITSAKAVDVDLSSIAADMIRDDRGLIKVTLDLRPAGYAPKIKLNIGENEVTRNRTVRLTPDGIDLNGDSATDITILSPVVSQLHLETHRGTDDVQLDARQSLVAYRYIRADIGAGNEHLVIRAPNSAVVGYGGGGDDVILLEGATTGPAGSYGWSGGGGDEGNDVLNARAVRGGGGFSGGYGNDKLFLGPGNDSIKEEEWGFGNDLYDTGAGNDRIWDYQGHDVIRSGAGNDDVAVSGKPGGWDIVTLGAGNDRGIVSGKTSRARMNAGAGNDTVFFFGSSSIYSTLECGPGRDRFISVRHDKARNCERLD